MLWPTLLDSMDTDHFHHCRRSYWVALFWGISVKALIYQNYRKTSSLSSLNNNLEWHISWIKMSNSVIKKLHFRGFPGGLVMKNLPTWSGRILHALEQLSPCTTTAEPVLWSPGAATTEPLCRDYSGLCTPEPLPCDRRGHCSEKPMRS